MRHAGDERNGGAYDRRGNSSRFLLPKLNTDESSDQDTKNDEQSNDSARAPCIFRSSPLKGQKEADDCRNEHRGSVKVKLLDTFLPSEAGDRLPMR